MALPAFTPEGLAVKARVARFSHEGAALIAAHNRRPAHHRGGLCLFKRESCAYVTCALDGPRRPAACVGRPAPKPNIGTAGK